MVRIVIADDDPDDRFLIKEAMNEVRFHNMVDFVHDGQELMDYLLHQNAYVANKTDDVPGLILLDLNMPKKSGIEVLQMIKQNEQLKNIPVVVLTTSADQHDIEQCYAYGVNSYIVKPITFDKLVMALRTFKEYWFELVRIPQQ